MSVEELERLAPTKPKPSLLSFLERLRLDGLDLAREPDQGVTSSYERGLLDTNVIAALINPNGAPTVKAWAAAQPEETLHLSVLTLGEYDKGIHNLGIDHLHRSRYAAARDALEARFAGHILPVSDAVVRRGGESPEQSSETLATRRASSIRCWPQPRVDMHYDPGRHRVGQSQIVGCGHAIDQHPDLIAPRDRVDHLAGSGAAG